MFSIKDTMKFRLVFSDFTLMALLYDGRFVLDFNGFGEGGFEVIFLFISCIVIIHIVRKLKH